MARRKLPYREGDWCLLPLPGGGSGLGLVARADGRGIALGYFFGPRLEQPPSVAEIEARRPEDAVLVGLFGDLGFLEGLWKVVHRPAGWDRTAWPLPAFARYDALDRSKASRIVYDEDTLRERGETPIALDEAARLPQDGLMGAGYVEIVLNRLLE